MDIISESMSRIMQIMVYFTVEGNNKFLLQGFELKIFYSYHFSKNSYI